MSDNSDDIKKAEEDLPQDVKDFLKRIPKENREKVVGELIVSQQLTSFHGPLPPPEVLKEYAKVLPGSPERLLKLVENEQQHTHKNENRMILDQIWKGWVGLIIGALLVFLFFLKAFDLAMAGHDWVAGIIFSFTIIAVAGVFVLHKFYDQKENRRE